MINLFTSTLIALSTISFEPMILSNVQDCDITLFQTTRDCNVVGVYQDTSKKDSHFVFSTNPIRQGVEEGSVYAFKATQDPTEAANGSVEYEIISFQRRFNGEVIESYPGFGSCVIYSRGSLTCALRTRNNEPINVSVTNLY